MRASARSAPARSARACSPKYSWSATNLRTLAAPCAALDLLRTLTLTANRPAGAAAATGAHRDTFLIRAGIFEESGSVGSTSQRLRKTSRGSDANWMPRGTLRDILHDGGIPPATPLPSICAGPEALRHCRTTDLPNKFLCWAPKQAPWRSL